MSLLSSAPFRNNTITSFINRDYDPWLPNVTSLIHGGHAAPTDEAGNSITNNGAVVGQVFSGNCAYFSSSGYLYSASSADFGFGTGDFTIEAWVYPKMISSSYQVLIDLRSGAVADGVLLALDTTTGKYYFYDGPTNTIFYGTVVHSINTWTHVALTRESGVWRLFVNGVLEFSKTSATNLGTSQPAFIGCWAGGAGSYKFVGFMDHVRITKGVARYVANFDPPTSFSNDPLSPYVSCYFDFETGLNDLIGHSFTNNSVVQMIPGKNSSDIMYFPGSGLAINQTTAIGANDFTVETWIYFKTLPASPVGIYDTRPTNTNGSYFCLVTSSTKKLNLYSPGYDKTGTTTLAVDTWYHVAVTRMSGTIYVFLNGVLELTYVDGESFLLGQPKLGIHAYGGSSLNGFMSDFRVTVGVARYVSNFTVANKELPDYRTMEYWWENTVLLLRMNGDPNSSTIVDERGNSIQTFGNLKYDSTYKRFGTTSLTFNGVDQYATIANNSAFSLGKDDFTIEFWGRTTVTDAGSSRGVLTQSLNGASSNSAFFVGLGSTAVIVLSSGSGWQYTITATGATVNDGIWHHIAFVRSGDTIYTYVDGIQRSSTALSAGYTLGTSTLDVYMGMQQGGYNKFSGSIDGLRITKAARYKNTFTPSNIVFIAPIPSNDYTWSNDVYWKYNQVLLDFESGFSDRLEHPCTTSNCSISSQARLTSSALALQNSNASNLTVSNCVFGIGSNDFTIEFWVNFSTIQSGSNSLISKYISLGSNVDFNFDLNAGKIRFSNTALTMSSTTSITTHRWYHVAVVRRSGVTNLFIDGNLEASSSVAYTLSDNQTNLVLGSYNGLLTHECLIDDLRITKLARYSGGFIPPTYKLPISA